MVHLDDAFVVYGFVPLGKWVHSGYFSQESMRVCNSNNIIHGQDSNVASRDIETPRISHIACFRETLTRHESGLLSTFGGGDSDHTCNDFTSITETCGRSGQD